MRLPVGQTVQLTRTETGQDGKLALGVFVVDLDHAANEELLFLCCSGFPVVWLRDGHGETLVTCPLSSLRFLFVLWIQMHVVLNGR
jgi:hypothetical protein